MNTKLYPHFASRVNLRKYNLISYKLACISYITKLRSYEMKIEEVKKVGSRRESNPGDLWLELPGLWH